MSIESPRELPPAVLRVAAHRTRWMSGLVDAGVSLAVIIPRLLKARSSFAPRVRERADVALQLGHVAPAVHVASARDKESHGSILPPPPEVPLPAA